MHWLATWLQLGQRLRGAPSRALIGAMGALFDLARVVPSGPMLWEAHTGPFRVFAIEDGWALLDPLAMFPGSDRDFWADPSC